MPALTAQDVTVKIDRRMLAGGQYRCTGEISFGDGVKTYPTGGIPLPGPDVFGCPHVLESLSLGSTVGTPPPTLAPPITTVSADGKYTLQLLQPGTGSMEEIPDTVIPDAQTYRFTAMGS